LCYYIGLKDLKKLKGTVSKYLTYRGYGFIEYSESEKDIFFHSSNFQSTEMPSENQLVEFRVIDTPKGKEAVDVKLVQSDVEQSEDEETEQDSVQVKGLDDPSSPAEATE
jgi:cold shock CspA family protein